MNLRVFSIVVAFAAFPFASRGDEAIVRLSVRPMAAPRPALKYQLLPELRELKPGNAAQNYVKCFMEQRTFFFTKQGDDERARYLTMPLAELPVDDVSHYGGSVLRQADWAARLSFVDWQSLEPVQNGTMETLNDQLGPLQILATALQVRFRGQVAASRFDDAIGGARTMFALGRHLGEHPTAVANLVGLGVCHLSLETIEEMLQQPKCPNLYWALTDLPCPLVDVRKGVQGDRTSVAANLRSLRDDAVMTESEIAAFVSHVSGLIGFAREQAGRSPRNFRARLEKHVKDKDAVIAASRHLVEAGYASDLVKTLPPTQVILLDEKRQYEIERDDRMKLLSLPLWQIDSRTSTEEPVADAGGLFGDFLPHIVKIRRTQARLDQQIALLRTIEALRLYAAEHDGMLPAKLADLSVPEPIDPVTGKPFRYAVEGTVAHIRGADAAKEIHKTESDIHYEVMLRK